MGKKINGMSASFYKLMYYPPEQSEWDSKASKSFFDSMKVKEVEVAETKQARDGTGIASIARSKKKTIKRKV
jgi:hypothetical protein|tara:strand:+ start:921 stop:1136 length:216 start_codon:yes stop_codon:yes gene_type:complete